jgi:hypothetical protein
MGFTVYYRSTRRVGAARAKAIRRAASTLNKGRTWLSCEPVGFFTEREDGRLCGGSKPNFLPHPDDVASAAREALPDGTVLDMLEILCQLSRDHAVDWEFSHDHDPGPIGFIRGGVCEEGLLGQIEAIGELADIMSELTEEAEGQPDGFGSSAPGTPERGQDQEEEDDDGPPILPFSPRNR